MPAAQRERFMANALAELGRLEATVDGLLSLARAEQPDARQRVDLQDLLEAEAAEHPGVTVEGSAAVVRGSEGQLRTVVANLLANARQHGGATARVVVRAFTSERETGFEVIDDGPGIPTAHLTRVFDRFFTTDRREGLGLGLALVRSVCRAHGGDVSVASRPGCTVLRVVLPR
jgi:signal transduction histidine kinase